MPKKFQENDLVWAKMKGHPPWPARVTEPPSDAKSPTNKFYVFFFGTLQYGWIAGSDLFPYEEFKDKFSKPNQKRKMFNEAVQQIQDTPFLTVAAITEAKQKKPVVVKKEADVDVSTSPTKGTSGGRGRKRKITEPSGDAPPTKKSEVVVSVAPGDTVGTEDPLPMKGRGQSRRRTREGVQSGSDPIPGISLSEATPSDGANASGGSDETPMTRFRSRREGDVSTRSREGEGEAGSYVKQLSKRYAERKEGKMLFSPPAEGERRSPAASTDSPLEPSASKKGKTKGSAKKKTKTPQTQSARKGKASTTTTSVPEKDSGLQTPGGAAYISSRTRSSTRRSAPSSPEPSVLKMEVTTPEVVKTHADSAGESTLLSVPLVTPSEQQEVADGQASLIPSAECILSDPKALGDVDCRDSAEAWLDLEGKTSPRSSIGATPAHSDTVVDILTIATDSTVTPPSVPQASQVAITGVTRASGLSGGRAQNELAIESCADDESALADCELVHGDSSHSAEGHVPDVTRPGYDIQPATSAISGIKRPSNPPNLPKPQPPPPPLNMPSQLPLQAGGSAFPMMATPSSLIPLDLSGSDAVEAALSATDHAMFELDSDIISLLSEVPDTMIWESPMAGTPSSGGGASSSGGGAPSSGGGLPPMETAEDKAATDLAESSAFSFPGDVFDVGVKVQEIRVESVSGGSVAEVIEKGMTVETDGDEIGNRAEGAVQGIGEAGGGTLETKVAVPVSEPVVKPTLEEPTLEGVEQSRRDEESTVERSTLDEGVEEAQVQKLDEESEIKGSTLDKGAEEVRIEGSRGSEETTVEGSGDAEEVIAEGSGGAEEVKVGGSGGAEEVKVEGTKGAVEVKVERSRLDEDEEVDIESVSDEADQKTAVAPEESGGVAEGSVVSPNPPSVPMSEPCAGSTGEEGEHVEEDVRQGVADEVAPVGGTEVVMRKCSESEDMEVDVEGMDHPEPEVKDRCVELRHGEAEVEDKGETVSGETEVEDKGETVGGKAEVEDNGEIVSVEAEVEDKGETVSGKADVVSGNAEVEDRGEGGGLELKNEVAAEGGVGSGEAVVEDENMRQEDMEEGSVGETNMEVRDMSKDKSVGAEEGPKSSVEPVEKAPEPARTGLRSSTRRAQDHTSPPPSLSTPTSQPGAKKRSARTADSAEPERRSLRSRARPVTSPDLRGASPSKRPRIDKSASPVVDIKPHLRRSSRDAKMPSPESVVSPRVIRGKSEERGKSPRVKAEERGKSPSVGRPKREVKTPREVKAPQRASTRSRKESQTAKEGSGDARKSQEREDETSKPKKKAGRPRKVSRSEPAVESQEVVAEKSLEPEKAPEKLPKQLPEEAKTAEETPKAGKTRGRTSLKTSTPIDIPDAESTPKAGKARGRKTAKSETATEASDAESSKTPKDKKARGKKALKTSTSESATELSDAESSKTPKAGKARGKTKISASESATELSDAESSKTPKAGKAQGRKKMSTSESATEMSDAESSKTLKARGKKTLKTSTSESATDVSDAESSERASKRSRLEPRTVARTRKVSEKGELAQKDGKLVEKSDSGKVQSTPKESEAQTTARDSKVQSTPDDNKMQSTPQDSEGQSTPQDSKEKVATDRVSTRSSKREGTSARKPFTPRTTRKKATTSTPTTATPTPTASTPTFDCTATGELEKSSAGETKSKKAGKLADGIDPEAAAIVAKKELVDDGESSHVPPEVGSIAQQSEGTKKGPKATSADGKKGEKADEKTPTSQAKKRSKSRVVSSEGRKRLRSSDKDELPNKECEKEEALTPLKEGTPTSASGTDLTSSVNGEKEPADQKGVEVDTPTETASAIIKDGSDAKEATPLQAGSTIAVVPSTPPESDPLPEEGGGSVAMETSTDGGAPVKENGEHNALSDDIMGTTRPPPILHIQTGMSAVEILQIYNYNLKASLVIDGPNIQQALMTLRDLLEVQYSTTDLDKVPDLVYTLRKLRRYRANIKIVRKADEIYSRMKAMYLRPQVVPAPVHRRSKTTPTMLDYINKQANRNSASASNSSPSKLVSSRPPPTKPLPPSTARDDTPPLGGEEAGPKGGVVSSKESSTSVVPSQEKEKSKGSVVRMKNVGSPRARGSRMSSRSSARAADHLKTADGGTTSESSAAEEEGEGEWPAVILEIRLCPREQLRMSRARGSPSGLLN